MTRLDRYLFKQGGIPFLLILACTTAVIWLTQMLQRIDLMVEDGGSLSAFLQVTVLLIPNLMGVITPFAMLAAVLYAVNVLMADSELPVMSAAGASRMRIARSFIALSALASIFVFVINVDLQPRSYRVLQATVQEVRSDLAKAFIRSGVFSEVSDGITVYAEEVRPGDQYIGLFIHDARTPEAARTITAERGLFQVTPNGPRLVLAGATTQDINPETGRARIVQSEETSFDIDNLNDGSAAERRLDQTERYVSELLNPDLNFEYDRRNAGRFIAEGYARLATPLYPLAFTLLALAVLLPAPLARRGMGKRIFTVLTLAIFLRVAGYTAQSLAVATPAMNVVQFLIPIIASIVCTVIIFGHFWRVRRRPPPDLATVLDDPMSVPEAAR